MKNSMVLIFFAVVISVSAKDTVVTKIESDPGGMHIFYQTALKSDDAREFVGTSPCYYTNLSNSAGEFVVKDKGEGYVRGTAIFTAEPPFGSTNLFAQKLIFHSHAHWQNADKIPAKIFFDMHKSP